MPLSRQSKTKPPNASKEPFTPLESQIMPNPQSSGVRLVSKSNCHVTAMDTPLLMVDHRDIKIYKGPINYSPDPLYCSSLEGQREVNDVFAILDTAVVVGSSNNFVLREINDSGTFLDTVYARGAPRIFKPGKYIIVPQEDGERVLSTQMITFASGVVEAPLPKKAEISDTGTEGSDVSTRDNGDGPRGFKMRLVYRDKGRQRGLCVDIRTLSRTRTPQRGVENAIRNKEDPLRLNSLENGILFCLYHHEAYDTLRFSIHPETHEIFAFHPAVAHLHGLQVTSPWQATNSLYPNPHQELLKAHFQTSIFTSLSAAAKPLESDNYDELELPEIPSNHDNEEWDVDPPTLDF
ncbi:hypothetical protein D9615_008226 [Tricholomella constricta]|uniref:HNH nuclease domain-containing protein n=1 Tax=Tricholomella constricta TaxID=117010 RepID=A0A8H5H3E1_9AGAR|nr:hypothetical protein D9615_008226 [Tricholomella constricta]